MLYCQMNKCTFLLHMERDFVIICYELTLEPRIPFFFVQQVGRPLFSQTPLGLLPTASLGPKRLSRNALIWGEGTYSFKISLMKVVYI